MSETQKAETQKAGTQKNEIAKAGLIWTEMSEEDLEDVARIEQESFSQPWSIDSFRDAIHSPDLYYLTAREGSRTVAYGGYVRSFEEACITNFAVESALRGRGIGSFLLEELMKRGREQGIERFTLEVRVSNEAAIRLYEKHGFRSVGIRKNFYSFPKEDAHIMWTEEHFL